MSADNQQERLGLIKKSLGDLERISVNEEEVLPPNLQGVGNPVNFFFFKPRLSEIPQERRYDEVVFAFDRTDGCKVPESANTYTRTEVEPLDVNRTSHEMNEHLQYCAIQFYCRN